MRKEAFLPSMRLDLDTLKSYREAANVVPSFIDVRFAANSQGERRDNAELPLRVLLDRRGC